MPLDRTMLSSGGQRVAIPHMDQYFGLWMHEPERLTAMVDLARRIDLPAHAAEGAPLVREASGVLLEGGIEAKWDREARLLRVGNVAVIELEGTLTKYGSSMSDGGSMIRARRDLARALRDKAVDSILLRIDSPGGTVAGTGDLAADIAEANRIKPVTAFIEDLGASAAYYLASQAGRIYMNPTGAAGSIGVFMLVYDVSGAAEQQGIKAVLVKAGQFKGAGAPGTEITEAQRAEWQRSVDESYEAFVGAVARGRAMPPEVVRALADGRSWGAQDALAKGLIDAVGTLSDVIAYARNERTNRSLRGESKSFENAGADQTGRLKSHNKGNDMSFVDSLKAVLAGNPEAADADHRQIAQDAIEMVRAHDKTERAAEIETALKQGREEGTKASGSAQLEAALTAERERAAGVVGICAKAHLPAEFMAGQIKGGQGLGEVALAAIDQCAQTQPGIKAKGDHFAAQPDGAAETQANDDALLANASARAER